jgi:lysophospholipase L1-like esterase
MTHYAFGDSITAGTGASLQANCYVNRLNTDFSLTTVNGGVSTNMVMDQAPKVYGVNTVAGDVSTSMLGTNDQAQYAAQGSAGLAYYIDGLRALSVWLASECSLATPANGVSFSGAWGTGYAYSMHGASAAGATAAFTTTGDVFILGTLRQVGNASTFTVTVDGVLKGSYATAGAVTTLLGVAYGPYGIAITGLGAGSHAVAINVTHADASNPVYFHWYSSCAPKSKVVLGNTPHALAYTFGGSNANVDAYNTALAALAAELSGYGLDVSVIDSCSQLNPGDMYDNVHPNDYGHMKIRTLFYKAITGNAAPVIYIQTAIYLGSDGNLYGGESPLKLIN